MVLNPRVKDMIIYSILVEQTNFLNNHLEHGFPNFFEL